jgi:peptidoglycan hydrolase-like protein with peptidoglycan-binding domain
LRAAGEQVGVYTTSAMWTQITRGYRLDVPNWIPSGDGRPHDAARMCRSTATGGVTWLVQYTRALDSDLTCPVLAAAPGKPGPLWPYRSTTLAAGSSGPAVSAVQAHVATPVTGTYSATTVSAVKTWQSENHLPVTGTVTPADWRALGADQKYGGRPLQLARFASSP